MNWLSHDLYAVYIVVSYFAYQCLFDDLLFCCKTCAIDIGLLKTIYLLTYLLTASIFNQCADKWIHDLKFHTVGVVAEQLGIFRCIVRSWQSAWSRSSRPVVRSWTEHHPCTERYICRPGPSDIRRNTANQWLTWRIRSQAPPTSLR